MRHWLSFTLVPLIACGPSFYQAPPTLGNYPERLATKSWLDLYHESAPLDAMAPKNDELAEMCRRLPEELKDLPTEAKLKRIDALIDANRAGGYSATTANFLHEIRELAAVPAAFDVSGPYLAWRWEHRSFSVKQPPATRPWNVNEEEFAKAREVYAEDFRLKKEEFRAPPEAPPVLLPYWKVQEGAFLFRSGFYQEAATAFEEVVGHYAGSPRAEVAALMLARCRLEEGRRIARWSEQHTDPADSERRQKLLGEAKELLEKFISRYPAGRFTQDAHGWCAAVALEYDEFGLAVKEQLARLDVQPTREVTGTVLRECDSIFEKLFAREETNRDDSGWADPKDDFDAVAVANHPLVARLFIQHALDPAAAEIVSQSWRENWSSDRGTIQFLKQRVLRCQRFVGPALLQLGEELLKRSEPADETTLTVLAWSATQAGEHGQALALISQIRSEEPRDEALHAKAIILQRLGRHEEAVAAFDALEKAYPRSPLLVDLPQRRAISRFLSGHAGEAFLAFAAAGGGGSARAAGAGLNPEYYEMQWADTLLQFAPLDQLAAAADGLPEDSPLAPSLRLAIRSRLLAKQEFSKSRNYLSAETVDGFGEWPSTANRMDDAAWSERVEPLEELYAKLTDPAVEKSETELEIARYWMAHRGFITMPGLLPVSYANSEEEKQELLRRQNGLQLGFSLEQVNSELDARDEATHALAHALEAAKSEDPAISIPALELANECLFRRAEFSLYQRSRALETDATKLSKEIADRLAKLGAKAPVYAVFQPPTGTWMPGDYNSYHAAEAILDSLSGKVFRKWDEPDEKSRELKSRCLAVADRFQHPDAAKTLPQFRQELEDAKRELRTLRATLDPALHVEILSAVDRLDDLTAAASLPGITAADFVKYAAGAGENSLPPAFKSFLDFRSRLVLMPAGNEARNDTAEGWTEFLTTYPDSPKAEAASLRQVRLIARAARGKVFVSAVRFPEAAIPGGYKQIEREDLAEPGDPSAVLDLIAAHEKRFPAGRYRQDLNLLKAGALMDQADFSGAARCLLEILGDPVQGDLQQVAALNFCDLSQRLLAADERPAVVEAFRKNPTALSKLKLLMNGDTYLSRLKPLMPWLEAQL